MKAVIQRAGHVGGAIVAEVGWRVLGRLRRRPGW
jgi:hypothetical protein